MTVHDLEAGIKGQIYYLPLEIFCKRIVAKLLGKNVFYLTSYYRIWSKLYILKPKPQL